MKDSFNKREPLGPDLTALRQAGYRQTQARAAILEVLQTCDGWLNAEAVHQRAQDRCPGLGRVTVYRTLALLSELGLVRRIHHEDGCHGYARAGYAHGHHLVCRDCHTVVEFPGGDDLGDLIRRLEGVTGYAIENHLLELLGVCPACQQTAPGS